MGGNLAQSHRLRVMSLSRDAGYGGIGGAEMLVFEFARRLDRERFESWLCTTREPELDRRDLATREAAELRREGVEVLTLDRRSSWSMLPWLRLLWALRHERIDIVHSHMPRASIPGALLAKLAGVPVVIAHEHGSILYGHWLRRFLNENVVVRLSNVVLVVSDWDRDNLIEHDRLPASRVKVFRNGIPRLPAQPPDVRPDLAPRGVPLIGSLGRLDPVKGYDELIRAIALLKREGLEVRCAIAGVGPDETRLRAIIAKLGVGEEVALLGLREDVPSLLAAFDIAVLSSHSEGAPLAIIEYMAAGLPIVSTRVGGVPELIEDGRHGLLVDPGEPGALAAGLRKLIEDPELRSRLAQAARQRQLAELDLDTTVRRLEDLYLSLFAANGGRDGRGRGRLRRRLTRP